MYIDIYVVEDFIKINKIVENVEKVIGKLEF